MPSIRRPRRVDALTLPLGFAIVLLGTLVFALVAGGLLGR